MGDAADRAAYGPWIAVAGALLANYALAVARASDHTFIEWGPTDLFTLAHPWTLVILLTALAAHRGRALLASAAAVTALVGPALIHVLRGGPAASTPLCCTGGSFRDGTTAALELAAMLLMVAIPVLAMAKHRPREATPAIPSPLLVVGHLLVALPAMAIVYLLTLAAPEGRLGAYTLAAAAAAVMLGAAIGAGGGPWWLAILPALWWWDVIALHTEHDAVVGLLLVVGSLATPVARRLHRGWVSADPATHADDHAPLVSTTS